MRTQLATCSGLILFAFGAYVLAQQSSTGTPEPNGPFTVKGGCGSDILVDNKTGRTWLLSRVPGHPLPIWLALDRIDGSEDAKRMLSSGAAEQERRASVAGGQESWESKVRRLYPPEKAEQILEHQRRAVEEAIDKSRRPRQASEAAEKRQPEGEHPNASPPAP